MAARTCPCRIWNSPIPRTVDGRRLDCGRVGSEVPLRCKWFYHAGSVSTRAPRTPELTLDICGRTAELCSPPEPSPENRRRAGKDWFSPRPVAVTANTTYVASYFAPNGHYSADSQGTSLPRASIMRLCTRSQTGLTAAMARMFTAPGTPSRPTPFNRQITGWTWSSRHLSGTDTTPPTVTSVSPACGSDVGRC